MPRVLTVDDSRVIRVMVSKQARELGCEVDEAEDGEQALGKLAAGKFDLVVLDVTMPVLAGPEMMSRLRGRGDETPVLMLTSDSTREVVVGLMKLGISDYVLKPFKTEELAAKMRKILRIEEVQPGAPAPLAGTQPKPVVDVLLIDDMENVEKRLRTTLPESVSMDGARGSQAAGALCLEKSYRAIVIDTDIPNENATSLLRQLKMLQPKAQFVALYLRSVARAKDEARANGFHGHLFKPFQPEEVDEFMSRHLLDDTLIRRQDNVLKAFPYRGKEDRVDRYFTQITTDIPTTLEALANASFEEAIFDATDLPRSPEKMARFVHELVTRGDRLGVEVLLVGPLDFRKLLKDVAETARLPVYASVEEARRRKVA
jgi:DNA-binding response OmpR family regulator